MPANTRSKGKAAEQSDGNSRDEATQNSDGGNGGEATQNSDGKNGDEAPETSDGGNGDEAPETSTAKNGPFSSGFQSMGDFEREQAEKEEAEREQAEVDSQLGATPVLTPKQRAKLAKAYVLDPKDKAAEESATEEIGSKNWVGLLLEYRQAHPIQGKSPGEGTDFIERSNNNAYLPRFTCSVVLHEALDQEFGSNISFAVKKNAKRYAAKKAIDWLIEHKRMPSNGGVKFPKPKQSPQPATQQRARSGSTSSSESGSESPLSALPFTTQVPKLCERLGISVPRYDIKQATTNSPMCTVYAEFTGNPTLPAKVGEVHNIHGKKNAKEECARRVVKFLKNIEKERMAEFGDEDRSQ